MKTTVGVKEAALVLLSTAVSFALAEAAARRLMRPPYRFTLRGDKATMQMHVPDPEIGWVLSSQEIHKAHRFVASDGSVHFDVTYSIRDGQRRTSSREMHGPPVIVAGCSFTFGHGLNDPDTWPWLLQEKMLGNRLINVGTMAYGLDQAILAAQRQVALAASRPRAVILGFTEFQIVRIRADQGWMVMTYPFPKPLYRLNGSGVERAGWVKFFYLGPVLERSYILTRLSNYAANRLYRIPSHEEAREIAARLITGFAEQLRAKDVPLVVAMLAFREDSDSEPRADQRFMLQRLRQAGIGVVIPEFPRLSNGRLDIQQVMVSPEDFHPNRRYNEIVAGSVARYLKSHGLAD